MIFQGVWVLEVVAGDFGNCQIVRWGLEKLHSSGALGLLLLRAPFSSWLPRAGSDWGLQQSGPEAFPSWCGD